MEKAKNLCYTNKAETSINKSKVSWNVISEALGNSKRDRNIGDLPIATTMSEKLNMQINFSQVLDIIWDSNLFSLILSYYIDRAMLFLPFHSQQLELLVKNFHKTSPGIDDLCISIYKENFDLFGETLLVICHTSL